MPPAAPRSTRPLLSRHVVAVAAVLGMLGIVVGHMGHRQADEARFRAGVSTDRVVPNPPLLQVVSLGQPTLVADFLWVRTVLAFTEVHDASTAQGVEWIGAMLDSVCALDPNWRTSYFYGGSFMRVLGDIDHSDKVFVAGHEAFPSDSFFPFAIGMNAYLYRNDTEAAFRWITIAAELPNAPAWYRTAAAGFVETGGDRQAALQYLEQELRDDQKPAVREALLAKYNSLLHDELAAQIASHREKFKARFGRDIQALSELGTLPDDPLGGRWVVAPDGLIRSSVREDLMARQAVRGERAMILLPLRLRPN
jgi:hypothetical protein